jgi:hypothetical protein|tara:strand:+ start:60 stop:338 length:279 start_codon:yes stop_codon:yes gene_type:complete
MKNTIEYINQENQESAKNIFDRINPSKPKPEDIIHHISISKLDLEFLIKSAFETGRSQALSNNDKSIESVKNFAISQFHNGLNALEEKHLSK